MYKLTYETPTGKHERTFDSKPSSTDLETAAFLFVLRDRTPALLKPPVKTEAA